MNQKDFRTIPPHEKIKAILGFKNIQCARNWVSNYKKGHRTKRIIEQAKKLKKYGIDMEKIL
jgi:hypothetical protein